MRLEAVIVCLNYHDFLLETLPLNLPYFDDVIVVTGHADERTKNVCRKYSVDYVVTSAFHEHGDTFNKARAINIGLSSLSKKEWLIHLDADIVVPHGFRRMLDKALLNPKNIYGADRINVYGYDAWMKLKPRLIPHYDAHWFVDAGKCHEKEPMEGCKFGARVIHKEHGYIPIGFFQLFHQSAGYSYNHKLGQAAGSDVMFPIQWPRENRILLPEVVVYHLDSELEHGIGTNWKGRKSKHFGRCQKCDRHPCSCQHHDHHHRPYC